MVVFIEQKKSTAWVQWKTESGHLKATHRYSTSGLTMLLELEVSI